MKPREWLHEPSGTLFVLVSGGTFEMGVSRAEIDAMAKLDFSEDATREYLERMKPKTKKVKVASFWCAREPVNGALCEKVLGHIPERDPVRVSAKDAGVLARAFAKDGLRLITDVEWEWVARERGERIWINADDAKGAERACADLYRSPRFDPKKRDRGTNGLGIWGLPWGEFVAEPRGTRRAAWGVRGGAAMGYPWQSDEIVSCVVSSGYRIGKSKERSGVRFAVDFKT